MKTLIITILLLLPSLAIAHCPEEKIIRAIATEHNVDPKLAIAIMKVESNCNGSKIGSLGEVGIFQLRPHMHPGATGSRSEHINSAIRYLSYVRNRCSNTYGDAWFVCYNQGPFRKTKLKNPTKNAYYQKVMEAYEDPKIR